MFSSSQEARPVLDGVFEVTRVSAGDAYFMGHGIEKRPSSWLEWWDDLTAEGVEGFIANRVAEVVRLGGVIVARSDECQGFTLDYGERIFHGWVLYRRAQ